jgi:hypothetical protein
LWRLIKTTRKRIVPAVAISAVIRSSVLGAGEPIPEPVVGAGRIRCITEYDASVAIPIITSSAYTTGHSSIGDTLRPIPVRALRTASINSLIDTTVGIRVPAVTRSAIRWISHICTGLSVPVETAGTLRSDGLGAALTIPCVPWIASNGILVGCAEESVPVQTIRAVIVVPVKDATLSVPDIAARTLGGGTSTTIALHTDSVLICVTIITRA